MRFCDDHWARLREAITAQGLDDLIAPTGERAAANIRAELEGEPPTLRTFDPLMGAHWAIVNNVSATIGHATLYLLGADELPEDPVDPEVYPAAGGRTWPRCPLCYLNLAHELTCTDPSCLLDRVAGYDVWIERAAADMRAEADRLIAEGAA